MPAMQALEATTEALNDFRSTGPKLVPWVQDNGAGKLLLSLLQGGDGLQHTVGRTWALGVCKHEA